MSWTWNPFCQHFSLGANRVLRSGVISSEGGGCKELSEVLPFDKIPLVANAHPFQVDPGIGFLCTLEGFAFVSGCPLPDHLFREGPAGLEHRGH